MPSRLLIVAVLSALSACADTPDATEPEDDPPLDPATLAVYLPPVTIVRAGPAPQVDSIDLTVLPGDRFMGPFRLYVREHAGVDVTGTISLNGATVYGLGSLAPGDSVVREIIPGSATDLVLTLSGAAGGALTLRIEAAIMPPPRITIDAPARSAMLTDGSIAPEDIVVTGEVCDSNAAITSLRVDGVALVVTGAADCVPFTHAVESAWGMTTFAVEATNARGRSARHVQSFLRGPDYSTPALTLGDVTYDSMVDVRWAAAVRYEQTGLQKLASLIPGALNDGQSLGSGFPGTMQIGGCASAEWQVTRGTPSSNVDRVELTIKDNQTLNVRIQFDLTIPFTADYCGFNGIVQDDGTGTIALANAFMDGDIATGIMGGGAGGVEVGLDRLNNIDVSNAVISLVSLGSVPPDHIAQLRAALMQALGESIGADGTTLMEEAAQIGLAFERLLLTSDGLNGIGVGLMHTAEIMELRDDGANVGFRAQAAPVTPRGGTAPPRGSIRSRTGLALTPSAGDVNEYLHDDFVNQVLWAAWFAGFFDTTDLEALTEPVAGLTAELHAELPPVLMPGPAERVRFGWGDASLAARVDPAAFRLNGSGAGSSVEVAGYGSVVVETSVRYDSIGHRLVLDSPTAAAQVDLASPVSALLDEEALRAALTTALEQAALERIALLVEALPLPEADLTGMFGATAGTQLDLLDPFIVRGGSFHRVGGSIGAF